MTCAYAGPVRAIISNQSAFFKDNFTFSCGFMWFFYSISAAYCKIPLSQIAATAFFSSSAGNVSAKRT